MPMQNYPIINLPYLYKYGLTISNYGKPTTVATSNMMLKISAGMCRDANNVMDIEVGSSNIENGTSSIAPLILNAAVNGINGLDVGSLAAKTMYAIYILADSKYYLPTGCIATLASNSLPYIPEGYDSYRLIGYWPTGSLNYFEAGAYVGIGNDMIFWYAGTYNNILLNGNQTATTPINVTNVAPPIDNTLLIITAQYIGATVGNFSLWANPNAYTTAGDFFQYCQTSGIKIINQFNVMSQFISGQPTISYRVSNGADDLSAWINGFYVSV